MWSEMLSKQYLETAQSILQAAQTMTDRYVARQLKALAEDYERRAEKAALADAAKALARSAARAQPEFGVE
jgi:aminopeptidase N